MIYALLNRNARPEDRERIAQAIQERRADDLRRYADNGIINHIMDVQSGDSFYCIHCLNEVTASPRNPPAGQRAAHHWHFRHSTNNECFDSHHNIGNGTYRNPRRHGCYIQLGRRATHPHTRCQLRQGSQSSYCHHAFTTICPGRNEI